METLLTVLHVLFCLFLILVILLQTGKGAGMGAAFGGGGSSTVFGPRGAGSFIGKATGVVAALFMLTSLSLAYVSSSKMSGLAEKASLSDDKGQVEDVDFGEGSSETTEALAEADAGDEKKATTDAGSTAGVADSGAQAMAGEDRAEPIGADATSDGGDGTP